MIMVSAALVSQMSLPLESRHEVRAAEGAKDFSVDYYTCPMHSEVHSKSPGECPICHMKLIPANAAAKVAPSSGQSSIIYYRNPMNPTVTSKKPMKDNMGMDYVPVFEDSAKDTSNAQSDVTGRGTVHLEAGQLGLSGVNLVKAVRKDLSASIPVSGRVISSGRVSIQVSERDTSYLMPGAEVLIETPMALGAVLAGRVVAIDSFLDPTTRSLRAEVALSVPHSNMRTEGSVVGWLKVKRTDKLVVPEAGVVYTSTGPYVFLADQAKSALVPRKVQIGMRDQDAVEIVSGLIEGDLISSGPNFLLDSESRIRAVHD